MPQTTVLFCTSVILFLGVFLFLTINMLRLTNEYKDLHRSYKPEDLFERATGLRRDSSDSELVTLLWFQLQFNIPINLVNFFLQTTIVKQGYLQAFCNILCVWYMFGGIGFVCYLAVVSALSVIACSVGHCGTWMSIGVFYIFVNSFKFMEFVFTYCKNPTSFLTALAWVPLKAVSASVDQREIKGMLRSATNSVMYSLHTANLVYGPFISYDDFKTMTTKKTPITVILQMLRYFSFLLFITAGLHFFHFNKLLLYSDEVNLSGLDMMTCVFFVATFFSTKVMSLYGCSYALLSEDFLQLYGLPKCVAFVYDYRGLLRRFDVTLYRFFVRYVIGYQITCWKKTEKIMRQGVCFFVVCLFHGASNNIMWWCLLNFIVGQVRKAGQTFCQYSPVYGHLLLQIPLTVTSMVCSILFLVDGKNHLNLIFKCATDLNVWILVSVLCVAKKMLNLHNVNDF